MYTKYQIINILEIVFQNMNCFFRINLIPVLIDLKYWYCNPPYLQIFCFPYHSCLILPQPTETSVRHSPHRVLHRLPCFSLAHSTTWHHKYWIYQTIWQAKPIRFIIKLHQDQNNLWVKKDANHQKAESLRTRSAITTYLIQNMLNSVQNGRYSFIITNLLVHTTTPSIYTKNLFVCFSQFLCPYFTLICSQNYPQNPH